MSIGRCGPDRAVNAHSSFAMRAGSGYAVPQLVTGSTRDMTQTSPSKRFAIAVSFPGEHRPFVRNVVKRLAEVLGRDRIFYDEWYTAELLGQNGDAKLRAVYRDQTEMVVPFFSEHYKKPWCGVEWHAIKAMLFERRDDDAVIPVQMVGTIIPGWEKIDIAIRKGKQTGNEVADLILAAYRLRHPAAVPVAGSAPSPSAATQPSATNFATTQLSRHAPKYLFGRDAELCLLDTVWAAQKLNVFSLVAWGGAGKTSLVFQWVQTRFATQNRPGVARYFDWSFYSQGTGDCRQTSADLFISQALQFFGDPDPSAGTGTERGERLAGLIRQQRTLLVLDGIEPLQYPPSDPQAGRLKDPALESLLRGLAFQNPGLVIITSREHLTDIEPFATA
jgi:hypothetical protein